MNNLLKTHSLPVERVALLTCALAHRARLVDFNDILGLVCRTGSRYGAIGRITGYQDGKFTLSFMDQNQGIFTGPSLDDLTEPSLNQYDVEPFYIGDLNKNRGIRSISPTRDGVYESMKSIGRTHAGLVKLGDQINYRREGSCASRVQAILRTIPNDTLDGNEQ